MLIYLIAGEPSGDMLGARLMRALKERQPDVQFAGVGGENMEKEGIKPLFDISDLAIMGLAEVVPSIPKVLRRIRETVSDIQTRRPDAVITIDSWSFSARVHKALRRQKSGILQMHYVAPQVWAWKKGRAKTMYKYIDRLLTLFPNEPAYFTPYRLAADFVGHPVIESSIIAAEAKDFLRQYHIPAEKRIVLLLPGSRHNEVARLLPLFLATAAELKKKHPELYFVLPTVKTVEQRVRRILAESNAPEVLVLATQGERYAAAKAASAAIAASGTVALELAIIDVPHLIAYKVPALTAWLVRRIADVKYANLTNILLNRLVVPELLQEKCDAPTLLNTAEELLNPQSALCRQEKEGFAQLRQELGVGEQKPSQKAADVILKEIAARANMAPKGGRP